MTKPKIAVLVVALLAGGALVNWQQQQTKRLLMQNAALREQVEQFAPLQKQNEHLMKQLKAVAEDAQADVRELARLRAQTTAMQQTERENVRLRTERERLVQRMNQPPTGETKELVEENSPERKLHLAKMHFAKHLAFVLRSLAEENDGRLPSEVPRVVAEMLEFFSPDETGQGVSAKHFELVYKGSLNDLKDLGLVVLAREKEPTQRADGTWVRTYALADGSSQLVGAPTRDGFAVTEKRFGFLGSSP
jgi:hypothetical protein